MITNTSVDILFLREGEWLSYTWWNHNHNLKCKIKIRKIILKDNTLI